MLDICDLLLTRCISGSSAERDIVCKAAAEIARLRAAAERVCWFDWSDNDDDAVAAVEALRKLVTAGQKP